MRRAWNDWVCQRNLLFNMKRKSFLSHSLFLSLSLRSVSSVYFTIAYKTCKFMLSTWIFTRRVRVRIYTYSEWKRGKKKKQQQTFFPLSTRFQGALIGFRMPSTRARQVQGSSSSSVILWLSYEGKNNKRIVFHKSKGSPATRGRRKSPPADNGYIGFRPRDVFLFILLHFSPHYNIILFQINVRIKIISRCTLNLHCLKVNLERN